MISSTDKVVGVGSSTSGGSGSSIGASSAGGSDSSGNVCVGGNAFCVTHSTNCYIVGCNINRLCGGATRKSSSATSTGTGI